MVSGERTGPKNLTIPHADTWVRWELLKINNVRLHYGAGFHQWMGYLRYPLKSETAAVCEEIEKETMVSISNLRHAMYLIFVVAACLFCWGRRCCCCCLILLVLFFVYSNLFLVCLFACLVFFVVVFVLAVVVVFFFRLCANFQLTKCSIHPLSPDSAQNQFSPNDIHRLSWAESMRINKMITKRKIFDILPNSLN